MSTIRPHARLAPSSASRWIRCPASVNFIEDEGLEDDSGPAADEGSILHALCEDALRTGTSPYSYVGQIEKFGQATLEITDDLADKMQEGLDLIDDIPGKLWIERRLDLGRWMPGQFGTMDVGIASRKLGVVFDWKWGYIPVEAVDNDQGRIYLLGLWDNFVRHIYPDLKKFRIIIFQPRSAGGGGEWDVHLDDVLDWGEKLKKAAKRTYDKDAPFIPGPKQCEYCPAAKNLVCEAYKRFNMEAMLGEFDEDELDEAIELDIPLRLPSSSVLTPERRSFMVKHKPMILKFLDRISAETLDDAVKGRPTPLLKAVYGRHPARKWADKEQAEESLSLILPEEDLYNRKLISPTQLQKLVPEKLYTRLERELVDRGEPKPVLVSAEDRRPAIPSIKSEFDEGDDD